MTEEQKTKNLKAFDTAHQNRLFEVDLFWKRALFFWGFIAATFVGYVTINKQLSNLSIIISVFGFVCSFAWTLANRGSKYWQEYWERKVENLETEIVGELFIDDKPFTDGNKWLSGRKFSVSKLAIAISDYLVFLWLCIALYEINKTFSIISISKNYMTLFFISFSIVYMILVYQNCKSRIEKNEKFKKTLLEK